MVHHNEHHGNGAEEDGKLVKVVVGDHLEERRAGIGAWSELVAIPLSDCIDADWLAKIQRKCAAVQLMISKLTGYSGMVVITSAGCDNLASNSV